MNKLPVKVVTFSPTRTTYKVCQAIAEGINYDYQIIDLTLPKDRMGANLTFGNEIVILGMPVYVGRIPKFIVPFLKQLKGNQTPAIIVSVYGNRHYDDALIEMYDILKEQGFIPLAAAACVGEHSFNTDYSPIGVGRPNAQDLDEANRFGQEFTAKWERAKSLNNFRFKIPGESHIYREVHISFGFTPDTIPGHEDQWAACAKICPTAAMYIKNNNLETKAEKCIHCMACVKQFPELRYAAKESEIMKHAIELSENFSIQRVNEFFL